MSEKPKYYITTAIAYPNGAPHVGHAYEVMATDALARFKRLDGYDVFFLTGTDEHGIKMVQTAGREGLKARELADRNVPLFQAMDAALGISHDDFIRTTEERHYRASHAIWERMEAAGDIYLDSYAGWYSVRDEAFYASPRPSSARTACAAAHRAPRRVDRGGELFLPPLRLSGPPARPLRGEP